MGGRLGWLWRPPAQAGPSEGTSHDGSERRRHGTPPPDVLGTPHCPQAVRMQPENAARPLTCEATSTRPQW